MVGIIKLKELMKTTFDKRMNLQYRTGFVDALYKIAVTLEVDRTLANYENELIESQQK